MKPVLWTVNLVSLIIVFGLLFSSVQPAFAILQLENDGHERRDYSSETGKLTFLGAEPDKPITVRAGQERGISAEQRSMAMVEAYGSEFGLKAPAQELMLKMESKEGGREITRYQQIHLGIPVMGGELVVNATEKGELLSMNGEISPDLDISVAPLISREQAQETALAAVAKWNQLAVTELQLTAPELWIYDSRLLEADGTPPALVWRMDVFSADGLLPIRELVLVDAQRGHIALHFNQVDTTQAVHSQNKIEPRSGRSAILSATNVVYVDLVVDVARNRLYGTDKIGNKVDVIDMMDMHLISSYLLVSGSSPTYLDIRSDGAELAVAQSGLGTIAFINLADGTVTYSASLGTGVKGSDALYGRDGTLYILSTAGVHVFDTRTHLEDSAQKVLVSSYPKTGVLSADKNTLYFVANSSNSGDSIAYKFNISAGLVKPIQLGAATISNTSFLSLPEKYIKLSILNNGWLLTSAGWVFDSSLILKGVTSFRLNPAISIPGKNFYAVAVDETGVFDKIRFFDQDSSYELSWTDTGTIGTIGAMAATPDGSALYISSTAGMGKINIGVTPPGTSVPLPVSSHKYNDFAFDLARNVIYGTSTAGTVDVISANDGSVTKEYLLPSGARPIGIDLSPDGSEIAIALNGLQAILFMDPQTGEIIASVRPNIYDENLPFDVIYGRSGRLYSDGNPGSSGVDYIHVFDTSTHTWLAKSPYPNTLRTGAEFAITADNQYLYANQTFSPNNIYVYDIRTDTVSQLYKGPHGPVYANRFTINPDGSKVFTSNGQVWTGIMSEQIGSFATGKLIEFIPGKNVFALVRTLQSGTSDEVLFFSASDYQMISTYTLASNDTILEMESAPDGSKLALSLASRKVLVLDLNAPQISILDGSGQMAFIEKPFSKPLKLKIQTILGGGISGQTVNFTAPASGPSATFVDTGTNVSSAITDASGVATSAMLTANNLEGSYVITATASGLADPVNFQLFNTVQQIKTYTTNGSSALPGTLLCDQNQPNCTNGTNPDADAAHRYAFGTYNFYTTHHDRNSIDDAGMPILSTVDYCDPGYPCPYDNAFWSGTQMVYGDGYPVADDIVAHELTHGVTQYESNLFYYYQSGAINESFSDIWGELYDQSNGQGTDTLAVKWLIGEDAPGGAFRSMSNPPAYGDPDSISSLYYYVGEDDNGGVHYNSGVNNKAAFLLVDGGSLNGKTVAALGADKTLAIYYEAQANLLVSGSDYADLYQLLYQACINLVGANGIAMADCQEVRNASDAVRMDQQPVNDPDYNRDAPLCPADAPKIDFLDDLENGSANWSLQTRWSYDSPYSPFAHSGEHYLYADGYPASISDTSAALKEITIPYNAYLHFSHAYNFEDGYYNSQVYYFDGGVLEYSTDAGASWHDAGGMMDFNGYPGTIYAGWNNPLLGRPAFVGNTKGYISTRVNLAPLAGSQVKFRWRMGLDDTGSSWGWWLDDVKVYTCGADTSFADVSNTYWAWSHVERLYAAGITGGCANNPLRYCPESTVTRAQMAIFLLRGIHGSAYTPPSVGDSTGFSDVPVSYWASAWIKQFYAEGITGGCGSGVYCPDQSVTRAQMAIFLLRAKHGSSYSPPDVDGSTGFGDVAADYWAAAWIKQLAAEGITSGCGNGNYCPETPVTRAQMAIFLVRAFGLP